jgi:hypothetical protein
MSQEPYRNGARSLIIWASLQTGGTSGLPRSNIFVVLVRGTSYAFPVVPVIAIVVRRVLAILRGYDARTSGDKHGDRSLGRLTVNGLVIAVGPSAC